MDANHPLRILMVEDVPSDAELAERELRNSGFQFTSVRVDTKEGFLKALEDFQPHLIISDYAMPEFDGMQALKLSLENDAKLPFIVLTGSMNEETAVACMKAGATDYVLKDRLARLPFAVREALNIQKSLLEKEAAEKELAESEARFRCLLQSVQNVAVQGYGPDGTIQYWNQASERLYGYTVQEAIGRNLVGLIIPPEMRGDVEQAIQQMVKTRQPIPASELFLMRKDGSRVPVFSSHAVIQVPGREPELFCIDIDLTERMRAEEVLREGERSLKKAQQIGCLGSWEWDIAGGRLTWSDELYRIWGVAKDFALTQDNITALIHPDYRAENAEKLAEMLESGADVQFEFRIVRPDGATRTLLQIVEVSRDTAGKAVRIVGIMQDITERNRMEEESKKYLAELENKSEEIRMISHQLIQAEKLATMGELSASIAHELNNPLATVSLRVESLLAQTIGDDPHRRELEIIGKEVERMGNLVSNLLQFSRRSQPQISTVNVCDEIEKTLELVHYHLRKHNIAVAREFKPEGPLIHVDRQQLRQLFLNLFTNASDAMPKGGTLTIHVTRHPEEKQICIEIADTGVGIPPEILSKVMEPFYTTKPEGKGTGLGLAICRRITEGHGGTLNITSEGGPGNGTRVCITLPFSNGSNPASLSDG